MFSSSFEYAVRALVCIVSISSEKEPGEKISLGYVSEKLNISFQYLTKIFQQLGKAGIIESFKGPKGGVLLLKDPGEITLIDIHVAIDDNKVFKKCCLGLDNCSNENPCAAHDNWVLARNSIKTMFLETSLLALAKKVSVNQKMDFSMLVR